VEGGVEKHAEQLYPKLVELGCDIEVVVRSPYVNRHQKEWKGVKFCRIWSPQVKGIEAFVHSFLGVLCAVFRRPDILHVHAIGPALFVPLARLGGLRVVVTHHGPDHEREKWNQLARRILRLGERWGMRFASERIVISRTIHDIVKTKYDEDSVVIPNGVDLPTIPSSQNSLEKYGLERGKYILLVSRFVPEKRHLDLIDAFARSRLGGWKLVLVGAVDRPSDYTKKVLDKAETTPNVVITGFQTGLGLQELYANAGIFALPSSHEGLPIVLLEALSYGVPVLASDIQANLEVGLPTDHYFRLGDIEMFSKRLVDLSKQLPTPQYRQQLRDWVKEWVKESYNWSTISMRTFDVYRKVVHGTGGCGS
jgi:glycosyltransferase involved in cell wall biosynthesis